MNCKQEHRHRTLNGSAFAGWLFVCGLVLIGQIALRAADDGAPANSPKTEWVFIGSGTKDIHIYRMDRASGALTVAGPAAHIASPSFLALAPNHRCLYAVSEGHSKSSSSVSAFSIDPQSAQLTLLNEQPSGGTGPCHVAVDPTGKAVLVANYSSGSLAVFPVKEGGALGEMSGFFQGHGSSVNPQRQEGPHAHCVLTDPSDRFALLCDLGLDKVLVFKFDAANASITPNDPPFASVKAGSGPRHIAFHPNGHFAYVINELAGTLTAFEYDGNRGVLHELQTESTLPAHYTAPNTDAEVMMHPSGKFVYGSNRGHDSITEFAVDAATGRLAPMGRYGTQGKTPRNFEIDPTGTFLLAANQDSNTVIVFRIDPKTGALTPAGQMIEVDTPMCVKVCLF